MSSFIPVNVVNGNGGNFPTEQQKLFNRCGQTSYCGSLQFKDARHKTRYVPIFLDECLEDYPETYSLLRKLRKDMKLTFSGNPPPETTPSMRSIHQNENGYLPWDPTGPVPHDSCAANAIARIAPILGTLPNNQSSLSSTTLGQFLEYTCGDNMHTMARLIVDYRFAFMYMTFGHYHADSFAMLVRSQAELSFEVKPTLPVLRTKYIP